MSESPIECPLDPRLAAVAAAVQSRNDPSPFRGSPGPARAQMHLAALAGRAAAGLRDAAACEDAVATDGVLRVPVRIYRPSGADATLPTVVFFHGGGFALGSIDVADDIARKLCRDLPAVVVSAGYRLAPEHPFPAAHDDAVAATRWALHNAGALGGDPRRVAVAGESAGANLATSAALSLRRDGRTPLVAQLLVVPGVDFARDAARMAKSGRDYPMLRPADLDDIAQGYLAGARGDRFPPSPMHAASLGGLPPAVIAVAGHDPLREEGLRYASRLRAEHVDVDVLEFPAMFHPFFGFFTASAGARHANDDICAAFARLIHHTETS